MSLPNGNLEMRSGNPNFNYEFLIFLIVSGLLSILFLLYFNRLFGSIVSYAIRTWTWHRYKVFIDIQALQISLLGGRLFFTGLRYHGSNETLTVQYGYVTWRYWLRRVREADVLQARSLDGHEGHSNGRNSSLPCRININLVGLEWFVYNRGPAYNSVFDSLKNSGLAESFSNDIYDEKMSAEGDLRKRNTGTSEASGERAKPHTTDNIFTEDAANYQLPITPSTSLDREGSHYSTNSDETSPPELPFILQLLPIHIECEKPAAVIGNENTRAILVVKANSVSADVDASAAQLPDPYQQRFNVHFDHPVIEMKDNDDFREDQPTRAAKERDTIVHMDTPPRRAFFRHRRRKVFNSLRNMVPYWRRSVESFSTDSQAEIGAAIGRVPGLAQWQGLSRYLDDKDENDKARWAAIEYGAENCILDSPSAQLTVYWDVVGKVNQQASRQETSDSLYHINGAEPPAWGMHLSVHGGTVNYGPWADRQRADLQRVFVPGLSKNATPSPPLPLGEWRVATKFDFSIDLADALTLRIPVREESKNWRWRGKEPPINHESSRSKRKQRGRTKKDKPTHQPRPAGWLELKIAADATVKYSMDMFACATGYKNLLSVDFAGSELRSSVNHDVLWRCGSQHISCDLSNPLGWNALRDWRFNILTTDLKLFLLRDHVFLLTDMVNDWASGPPPEYMVFTPYNYHMNLKFNNIEVYFNVNDANIVDNATSLDENAFILLSAPQLTANTIIPLDKYRPEINAISFDIASDTADLRLHAPQWNTEAAFLSKNDLAHTEGLTVNGTYHYNVTTSSENTDTLTLKVNGQSPKVWMYGFLVRYFILLKDNYFGDLVHFRTLNEYQEQLQLETGPKKSDIPAQAPTKQSNDLDVILAVKVDDPQIMLPTNLYTFSRYLQCELASLSVDLRFTNYYMDMELDLSPLSLALDSSTTKFDASSTSEPSTELFIDGVRVFGHRTFGLPPSEPTYLCNWDVNVGAMSGECSADFIFALLKGGAAFGFTFDDVENALVPYSSLIFHDITFVRVAVHSIHMWIRTAEAAFLASTDAIEVTSNDWARSHYSKRSNIHIPNLQVSCVDIESIGKGNFRSQLPVQTEAFLQTDIYLGLITRKAQFSTARKIQQELVRREDQRTNRTPFFLFEEYLKEFVPEVTDPPAQCAPPPPYPIKETQLSETDLVLALQNSISHGKADAASQVENNKLKSQTGLDSCSQQQQDTAGQLDPPIAAWEVTAASPRETFQSHETRLQRGSRDRYSIAFSSPYFPPRFPLDAVQPDLGNATELPVVIDNTHEETRTDRLNNINQSSISEDYLYTSTIVELPAGVAAFIKPKAIQHAAKLLKQLIPEQPEDILDSLQIDTITEISNVKKQAGPFGEIKDLLLKFPEASLKFLSTDTELQDDSIESETDQYDFKVTDFDFASRTTTGRSESAISSLSRTSLQLNLGAIDISAKDYLAADSNSQAAFKASITNILVSKGAKDVTYFDVDIGSFVASTNSDNIEYLAGLIHRSEIIASKLAHILKSIPDRRAQQAKLCCYKLVSLAASTKDPAFLIRPSTILRSVDHHLRTIDSWKLLMRLRQIWRTMSEDDQADVAQSCRHGDSLSLPHDATLFVSNAFQQWRSWDLRDVKKTVLFKRIFGSSFTAKSQEFDESPILGACRLREFKFTLDSGIKENTIEISELIARFQRNQEDRNTARASPKTFSRLETTINVSLADVAVNLNWEVCELADTILRISNRTTTESAEDVKQTLPKTKADSNSCVVHIVLDIVKATINLNTINLISNNLLENLRFSLLSHQDSVDEALMSAILSCTAVDSKLHSYTKQLSVFHLENPNITFSRQATTAMGKSVHWLNVSASSQDLALSVQQDAVGLLKVLDALVRDEVTQLDSLRKQLLSGQEVKKHDTGGQRASKFDINVVLFLGRYDLTLPLLKSLWYKISGAVARGAYDARHGEELTFDFDAKENSHEIVMSVKEELRSICMFDIPPTNGRITSRTLPQERLLKVLCSVEVVHLDASSIYNLLSAINRPQVSDEVDEIQSQIKNLRERISHAVDQPQITTSEAPRETGKNADLVYDVRVALAGLKAMASTSRKIEIEPFAQILFSLGPVHLQASNRSLVPKQALKYPELSLKLRKIGFDVRRGVRDSIRSCGKLVASVTVSAGSRHGEDDKEEWTFDFVNDDLNIDLSPETISTFVEVLGYLASKIKDLDTSREMEYLKKLRQPKSTPSTVDSPVGETDIIDSVLSSVVYRFQLRDIQASWSVSGEDKDESQTTEDLHLCVQLIEFGTKTKKSARLTIENFQVQMVQPGHPMKTRSHHSALLPEITFNVAYLSTSGARRMAFQAVGKSLDLRLTSEFIVPAAQLAQSISLSMQNVRQASFQWTSDASSTEKPMGNKPVKTQQHLLGNKRLESLLIDADFAGAVVHISGSSPRREKASLGRPLQGGRYGQFNTDDSGSSAVLRSPGLAWKAEYRDDGHKDPSLHGEVKVDASSNILYPAVVPLVLDIVSNVKQAVSHTSTSASSASSAEKTFPESKAANAREEENFLTADPSAVLGRLKLNLGLRICRQEFSLSCQPIARVAATACFESVYFTLNTITSQEQGDFFAISGVLNKPEASVQHVYSRDSTASFELETVTLSFMNSKHVSGISGISTILDVSPVSMSINARQVQDFLLFREIWYPEELRHSSSAPVVKLASETSQAHLVQRYQQVAATAAFPWTATISIAALDVSVDLGQAIGRSVFHVNDFWVSSKKTSDWEQNLCLGFDRIGIDCTGRLSGFIALRNFQLRTSIQWPQREEALNETPKVQGSLAFEALQLKAAFDYQVFLVTDITSLEFLMYNVRESKQGTGDRLVAILNGDAVQAFATTSSAAQVVSLYQALKKLMQENRENFDSSIKELEKIMSRKTNIARANPKARSGIPKLPVDDTLSKSPISLDTDVVVTLKALNLGIFPSTFSDHQVFKIEALNAYARFAASIEQRRVHSILRMTLGQLRIGLAGVRDAEAPKTLSEMQVADVVKRSTGARGGTILKVPRVEATMETWQSPKNNHIEYKFKSAFEGKVEVGWNYSRVSYIRGMWANHNKMLEHTWGRQLPMTAVKITGVPKSDGNEDIEQGKITAEVNVPQSKYNYTALETPIIETPQLRDMGEATPPLEWIGLNRERLPNLTHQIVIVSLLELAGEVEDAYSRILGSS